MKDSSSVGGEDYNTDLDYISPNRYGTYRTGTVRYRTLGTVCAVLYVNRYRDLCFSVMRPVLQRTRTTD